MSDFESVVSVYIEAADDNIRLLAARFEVSVPFVRWWADGRGRPHPRMQRQILDWIANNQP